MNRKQILFAFIALAFLSGAVAIYLQKSAPVTALPSSGSTMTSQAPVPPPGAAVRMEVAKYLAAHIAEVSPIKSDKKLLVTKTTVYEGKGTVQYGDGSAAYTADFTYQVDSQGKISFPTFVVRK